jgi:hypothetical protein
MKRSTPGRDCLSVAADHGPQRRNDQHRPHQGLPAAERPGDRAGRLVAGCPALPDGAVDLSDGDLQQQHQETGGQQAQQQAGAQALGGQTDQDRGQGFVLHAGRGVHRACPALGARSRRSHQDADHESHRPLYDRRIVLVGCG